MAAIAGVQCARGSKELAAARSASFRAGLFPVTARAYLRPNASTRFGVDVTGAGGQL